MGLKSRTESQNVRAASLVGGLEGRIDLLGWHVGASQMHASLESIHRLSYVDHLTGEIRQSTTGTPGDVNEGGTKAVHTVHSVVEVLYTLRGLRREELKGNASSSRGFILGKLIFDVHRGVLGPRKATINQ